MTPARIIARWGRVRRLVRASGREVIRVTGRPGDIILGPLGSRDGWDSAVAKLGRRLRKGDPDPEHLLCYLAPDYALAVADWLEQRGDRRHERLRRIVAYHQAAGLVDRQPTCPDHPE